MASDAAQVDAEQAKESRDRGLARLYIKSALAGSKHKGWKQYLVSGVAALDSAGVAALAADGGRSRREGEGKEREGSDAGEHGE